MIVGLYSTDQRKVITSGIPLNNLRIELNLKVNQKYERTKFMKYNPSMQNTLTDIGLLTCTHTCRLHAYIQTPIHQNVHEQAYSHAHTCICTFIKHEYKYTCMHIHIDAYIYSHKHSYAYTYTHIDTHKRTRAHTRERIQTYTHIVYIYIHIPIKINTGLI